jgi:hypothetical protein
MCRLCSDESDGEEGVNSGHSNNHQGGLLELDNKCFTPVEVPEGDHRLQSQYCLWYTRRQAEDTFGNQTHNTVDKKTPYP